MPEAIAFPDVEPQYLFDRDCLAFRAFADGKPVQCLVTAELLMTSFGARGLSEQSMREAYRQHRPQIQELARLHINLGWIDSEGRVFLNKRHTKLTVSFAGSIAGWSGGRMLVDAAHRMLLEIIGPNAGSVTIEWDRAEDSYRQPVLTLRITNPELPASSGAVFSSGG